MNWLPFVFVVFVLIVGVLVWWGLERTHNQLIVGLLQSRQTPDGSSPQGPSGTGAGVERAHHAAPPVLTPKTPAGAVFPRTAASAGLHRVHVDG